MTNHRSNAAEEEYFRRQEAERRRDDAWEKLQQATRATHAEHERLKALRLRRCPKCHLQLEIRTLRGVEVDQCSSCHGTWLDEGELEQLTRSAAPGLISRLFAAFRGNAPK